MRLPQKFMLIGSMAAVAATTVFGTGVQVASAATTPTITLAGSFTVYQVTSRLVKDDTSSGAKLQNLNPTATSNKSIPAGPDAPGFTYGPTGAVNDINGSTAGKQAICGLNSQVNAVNPPNGDNVIDIARTSSDSATCSGLTFSAFGADGVGFVVGKTSPAPKDSAGKYDVTPAIINAVFACQASTGAPEVTNWNQLAGDGLLPAGWTAGSGPITRYVVNPTSGTRSFFESTYLGGQFMTQNCNNAPGGPDTGLVGCDSHSPYSCPTPVFIEENTMLQPSSDGNQNSVIQFFASDQFTGQTVVQSGCGNATCEPDTLNGGASTGNQYKEELVNGVKATAAAFFGHRNVGFAIGPNENSTGTALAKAKKFAVGSTSFICGATGQSDRQLYGFQAPSVACGSTF